jgi:aminoglycoside phosphotransferase family enzyme/predicted kinase
LNRRLSPGVYLGVADLVGPDGQVQDHVVLMQRMPERRRLATLIRSGAQVDRQVREVARALAVFHGRAERSEVISRDVTAASVAALWQTSFVQMREHTDLVPGPVEGDIERLVGRYLAGRGELFRQRSVTSVLDGHGDLMAEDIFCLDDGPRILDCLEFDDRLRHVDQVDDAAFLAMDLEHLGARGMALRFLEWYAEFSGDHAPSSLVEHYLAYRAFVRAKVACVRHAQGLGGAAPEARRLLASALAHLQRGAVTLVVVGGPPGTGKSTVAAGLADRLGLTLLSSDRVRKELAQLSPVTSATAGFGEGIYTPGWSRRVYDELMRRAAMLLRVGESVVVDATWASERYRGLARETTASAVADLVELRCSVSPGIADARLRTRPRMSAAGTVSDASPAVSTGLRDGFEEWPTAYEVDTSGEPGGAVGCAVNLVRPPDDRTTPRPRSQIEPD